MARLLKITALVGAVGSSVGLAASLVVGQPAAAIPPLPPDLEQGQGVCVGVDLEVDVVDTLQLSRVCVPLASPRVVIERGGAEL